MSVGIPDDYLPDPPLCCPECGLPLGTWSGYDGPRLNLEWHQGRAQPTDFLWGGQHEALRLPPLFRIHAFCPVHRRIEAEGRCEGEAWTSTTLRPRRPPISSPGEMHELIEEELLGFRDPRALQWMRSGRVEPVLHERRWDYSVEPVSYPCWWVARFPALNLGAVYSDHGHRGWGTVELDSEWFGMDASWWESLEETLHAHVLPTLTQDPDPGA